MSDIEGDLQRRLANLIRRGVIHSVRNGEMPKCRVDRGYRYGTAAFMSGIRWHKPI